MSALASLATGSPGRLPEQGRGLAALGLPSESDARTPELVARAGALERRAFAARFAASTREARRAEREAGFSPERRRSAEESSPEKGMPSADARRATEHRAPQVVARAVESEELPPAAAASSAELPALAPLDVAPPPAAPVAAPGESLQAQALALPPVGVAAPGGPPAVSSALAGSRPEPQPTAVAPEPVPAAAPSGASAARTSEPSAAARPSSAPATGADIERAADVLRQIRAELHPGLRRVRIDLDPPELGRLVIRVALHEGRVSAVVEAGSAATLELLERQAPELRAALAQHGVDPGHVSLRLGSDPSRERGHGQARPRAGAARSGTPAVAPVGAMRPPSSSPLPSTPAAGVDTYA